MIENVVWGAIAAGGLLFCASDVWDLAQRRPGLAWFRSFLGAASCLLVATAHVLRMYGWSGFLAGAGLLALLGSFVVGRVERRLRGVGRGA